MATNLVAATNNRHKLEEMRRLWAGSGYDILSLTDVGIHIEVEEEGETFAENALIKARAVAAACGQLALGDDSGLCVDILDGAPGILSARFAGEHGDDAANNKRLLYLLERTPFAKRGAKMVCALALAAPDGAILQASGECKGNIGFDANGKHGFGYDSLFYTSTGTFADMEDAEKDAVSHRGKAVREMLGQIGDFVAQHGQTE